MWDNFCRSIAVQSVGNFERGKKNSHQPKHHPHHHFGSWLGPWSEFCRGGNSNQGLSFLFSTEIQSSWNSILAIQSLRRLSFALSFLILGGWGWFPHRQISCGGEVIWEASWGTIWAREITSQKLPRYSGESIFAARHQDVSQWWSDFDPQPQQQNSLLRIFRLQPGLEWKFSLRRTCCRGKNCSHCSLQDFHSLTKGNQVSLVRTFLSGPGSEGVENWSWFFDSETLFSSDFGDLDPCKGQTNSLCV